MSTSGVVTDVIRQWSRIFMHKSIQDFKHFMQETGLSFSQIFMLMRLYHGNNCNISKVGESLGVSNAAASQSVERLVQLGFVQRHEDPHDRRTKRLKLTYKGRRQVERNIQERSRWIKKLANQLSPEQHQIVISALTILTETASKTNNIDKG